MRRNIDKQDSVLENFKNGSFNMPEESDIEAHKDGILDEKEKEAIREKNRIRVSEIYEEREKGMDEFIKKVKQEIKVSGKGIGEAAKGLEGSADITYDIRSGLARTQKEAETELSKLEYDGLEAPENVVEGEPEVVKKEISDQVERLKSEVVESIEELRKEREAFVEKFIKESVEAIKEKIEKTSRGAKNWKNAEDIIVYKTEKEIRLAAKRFIELGDKADFGFEAKMEISSYDTEERGNPVNKRFITGYTIKVGDHELKVRGYDKPHGVKMVGDRADEEMKKKRRYGEKVEKSNMSI